MGNQIILGKKLPYTKNNLMQIIHLVLGKGNPDRMNGVNKVAYQLATTQTDMGHDVHLWGIANSMTRNYPDRNFKTTLFLQLKNKLKLDKALVAAINELNSDVIVHIHGSFIPEFYQVAKLLNRQEIGYIYTPHGALTEGAMMKNNFMKKLYFKLFESALIKRAKAMQLLGVQELAFTENLINTNNKCLIPNGQDMSTIPSFVKKDRTGKSIIFGFCGRIATFHKGLDMMLQGFKLFIEKGNLGTLELIGDGSDRPEMESLCKELGIEDLVTFHGAKFGDEKYELIAGFDVFLHTSRMEGFPTAVLEAAAMEKVCITSEATNINDYFRTFDSGLPMEKNGIPEIAAMMETAEKLFQNNDLEPIGKRARKMVEEEFSWTKVAQQLIDVYAG